MTEDRESQWYLRTVQARLNLEGLPRETSRRLKRIMGRHPGDTHIIPCLVHLMDLLREHPKMAPPVSILSRRVDEEGEIIHDGKIS